MQHTGRFVPGHFDVRLYTHPNIDHAKSTPMYALANYAVTLNRSLLSATTNPISNGIQRQVLCTVCQALTQATPQHTIHQIRICNSMVLLWYLGLIARVMQRVIARGEAECNLLHYEGY